MTVQLIDEKSPRGAAMKEMRNALEQTFNEHLVKIATAASGELREGEATVQAADVLAWGLQVLIGIWWRNVATQMAHHRWVVKSNWARKVVKEVLEHQLAVADELGNGEPRQ